MNQEFSAHQHTSGKEGAQTGPQGADGSNEKESLWLDVLSNRPPPRIHVEFVTRYGIRHVGITVLADTTNHLDHRGNSTQPKEVLFMSESTDKLEYYSSHQIEKWRETKEMVKKIRLLGIHTEQEQRHVGLSLPIFTNYAVRRLIEKLLAVGGDYHMQWPVTKHYQNEKGIEVWVAEINFGYKQVVLTETDGDDDVSVVYSHPTVDRTAAGNDKYNYKAVAEVAENICDYFLKEA